MSKNAKAFNRSTVSLDDQFAGLIKATLETWAHQILYTRRVYPSSTFAPASIWGVKCHACRAKDVVEYIQDSIETGLSALLKGSVSRLSLVIVEEEETAAGAETPSDHDDENEEALMAETGVVERERLTLSFDRLDDKYDSIGGGGQQTLTVKDIESLRQTERSMRDLILRVQSLPSRPSTQNESKSTAMATTSLVAVPDSTSFRLIWHLKPNQSDYGKIPQGFNNGTWMGEEKPAPLRHLGTGGLVRRPLYQASSVLLQVNFYSQYIPQTHRPKMRRVNSATKEDDNCFV